MSADKHPTVIGTRRHGTGWRSVVSQGRGKQVRQWFAIDTPAAEIRAWREDTAAERHVTRKQRATQGTLGLDTQRYLALEAVKALPTFKEREREIGLWLTAFGAHRQRDTITKDEIENVYLRWLSTARSETDARPITADTANKRLRALSNLYRRLDRNGTYNPVREVVERKGTPADNLGRSIDYTTIAAIIAAMSDHGRAEKGGTRPTVSAAKIRVRCMAYCQITPGALMAIRPADLDLVNGLVHLPQRQKARGAAAIWTPLTKKALEAFADFHRQGLYGSFSQSSVLKAFKIAARKVAPALKNPRVYDLRHSVATAVVQVSRDTGAAAHMLQHGDASTTKRYIVDSVPARVRAAVDAFDAYLDALDTPPTVN